MGHVAAVGDCEGVAALLECGAIDQLLRTNSNHEPIASSEVERAAALDEWVHICDTVPRLAGAKRMGARTIWLNQQAAADENSRGFTGEPGESSSYLARGVIADLADGVCGELAEIPATLEQVQLDHQAKQDARSGLAIDAASNALDRLRGTSAISLDFVEGDEDIVLDTSETLSLDGVGVGLHSAGAEGTLPLDRSDVGVDEVEASVAKTSSPKFCIQCGAPLPHKAKFCPECGEKLNVAAILIFRGKRCCPKRGLVATKLHDFGGHFRPHSGPFVSTD